MSEVPLYSTVIISMTEWIRTSRLSIKKSLYPLQERINLSEQLVAKLELQISRPSPERHSLAFTVLCVPSSLDSGVRCHTAFLSSPQNSLPNQMKVSNDSALE